jgi:hypothetical protein
MRVQPALCPLCVWLLPSLLLPCCTGLVEAVLLSLAWRSHESAAGLMSSLCVAISQYLNPRVVQDWWRQSSCPWPGGPMRVQPASCPLCVWLLASLLLPVLCRTGGGNPLVPGLEVP